MRTTVSRSGLFGLSLLLAFLVGTHFNSFTAGLLAMALFGASIAILRDAEDARMYFAATQGGSTFGAVRKR